ncbi:efflux RND transporter periplasmic adaptor subunit [Henriciella aquimarina]|uniref:efflux RND transporter periplasmic adaptor subunit n=1 Tax=Henriciella aquimarina TaxID=545261 RepID=UPI0009FC5999|nr:efflux RND transporter periplasmic adaptor subunit [Henriciella aquimarina]
MRAGLLASLFLLFSSGLAHAQTMTVEEDLVTDYKPVLARIEASDTSAIRSRLQGVVTRLTIDEGSVVAKDDVVAFVTDDTLAPQVRALTARIEGLDARIAQQTDDLARAEKLLDRGFYPKARFEQEQTALNVLKQERAAAASERRSLMAREAEGNIRAPADGKITSVVTVQGAVVSPGEEIARLATLDGVVRLSIPERHIGALSEGESVTLRLPARSDEVRAAEIMKIYPELRNGAVIADAEVEGGLDALVGERADVMVPVGERRAIRIPEAFVTTRYGVDFVRVRVGDRFVEAPVMLAEPVAVSGAYDVLSGLKPGDVIAAPEHETS